MELRPEHHGELNHGHVRRLRFEELRVQYKDDKIALQQIDVYDGATPYHNHFRALRDALVRSDKDTISREEA